MEAQRDRSYRLSPSERASVRPGLDANALERFLSHKHPSERSSFLAYFARSAPDGSTSVERVADPTLQPILDLIHAARLRHLPPEPCETARLTVLGR